MRFFTIVLLFLGLLYALDLVLLIVMHRAWWRHRWVRWTALLVPLIVVVSLGTWSHAHSEKSTSWVAVGAGLASIIFTQLAALLPALIVAGALRGAIHGWTRFQHRRPQAIDGTVPFPAQKPLPEELAVQSRPQVEPTSPERRRFLGMGLAAMPLVSAGAAAGGTLQSIQTPRIPRVPLFYPDLPADLQGLRILHLSDLHVGPYVSVQDVEHLMERAAALHPDLVVVTGDICDHLAEYLPTLQRIEALAPPLGTFASLGNHEYFRGLTAVRACFDRCTIQLLVEEGVTIPVGASHLHIAGADDPRTLADPSAHQRLRNSVRASLDGAPTEAFQLLLSHRSQAFDTAAPLGVNLTLSGHTHGFQIGVAGRSLLEPFLPDSYVWGHYGSDSTQLYTSAGVGHWLPFRLGCPTEAPLFVLTNDDQEHT